MQQFHNAHTSNLSLIASCGGRGGDAGVAVGWQGEVVSRGDGDGDGGVVLVFDLDAQEGVRGLSPEYHQVSTVAVRVGGEGFAATE